MTARDRPGGPEDTPDALLEEAAIWFARLQDALPDEASDTDFKRWLRSDPRHLRAFEEAERLWGALDEPVARVLADEAANTPSRPTQKTRQARVRAQSLALAACVLIATTAGLMTYDNVVDSLRSDHMTAVGEQAPLLLDDGSRVTLNTDTAVAIEMDPERRQVRLYRGEAWFDVSPDSDRPFIVETDYGAIRVTGTSFDVRLDGEAAIVSLAEGQVLLTAAESDAARSHVTLTPGLQARLTEDGTSEPKAFDETAVTAWLRGQLVFYDTPLPQVVSELNRYRTGRIVVASDRLKDLRISGVFSTASPDAAITVIADTLPVRVTKLTNYLVVLR